MVDSSVSTKQRFVQWSLPARKFPILLLLWFKSVFSLRCFLEKDVGRHLGPKESEERLGASPFSARSCSEISGWLWGKQGCWWNEVWRMQLGIWVLSSLWGRP